MTCSSTRRNPWSWAVKSFLFKAHTEAELIEVMKDVRTDIMEERRAIFEF